MSLEDLFKSAVKKPPQATPTPPVQPTPNPIPVTPTVQTPTPDTHTDDLTDLLPPSPEAVFSPDLILKQYKELIKTMPGSAAKQKLQTEYGLDPSDLNQILKDATQPATPQVTPTPSPQPTIPTTAQVTPAVEIPKPATLPEPTIPTVSTPAVSTPISTPISDAPYTPVTLASPSGKVAVMIYGNKGEGKTTLALGTVTITDQVNRPTLVALSFDQQTSPIHHYMFNDDPRILVYDIIESMRYDNATAYLESSEKTFNDLLKLLREVIAPMKPDWIVIDGLEILQNICEMVMRNRNNLMPFQGFANMNLWKERRMYLKQIHTSSMAAAKRGVIYTSYIEKDEVIKDGQVKEKRDQPQWVDIIKYATSLVVRIKSETGKDGRIHSVATVESSKTKMPTGYVADVTGLENMKVFWSKIL